MIPSNFHTHTVFCDGSDTPEDLVLMAISLGCKEIGFSGHSYTPFDPAYCMSPENEKKYIETVSVLKEKYSGKINILLGIEQDFYSAIPQFDYDYIIGSVHYVKKDGVYISVDDTPEILENGVKKYYNGDYYALVEDYYKNVADLYNKTRCNIVGHFDIVTKFNQNNRLFDTNAPKYISAYKKALEALFSSDCAFEINTHGGSASQNSKNYPDAQIEKIIKLNGRKIVYSSDCHKKDFLIYGIPDNYNNLDNIPRLK